MMSVAEAVALRPWDPDVFLEWSTRQPDERWELVDGYPLKMMAGATRRHDLIVMNIIGELRTRLRGRTCVPFTADGAVQTAPDRVRRPDAGIDCGPTGPDALKASETRVVFEVLSPSTRNFDEARKIAEYQALPSMRHIVFLSQNEPLVTHWIRLPDGSWMHETLKSLDEAITLDAVEITLPLREVYDRALD